MRIRTNVLKIVIAAALVGLAPASSAAQLPGIRGWEQGAAPTVQDLAIARIYVRDQAQVDWLAASGLDLLEARGPDYLLALLSPSERAWLAGQNFRVETDAVQTASLQAALQPDGPPGFACYRDVPAIEEFLLQVAADNPDLVELIDYGDSWEKTMPGGATGHDLWVARITNRAVPPPAGREKPRFFLMANIHARELTTPEVAMSFIQMLVDGHGVDADLTWIVDHHEIWVAPTTNPDGRDMAELNRLWRKNTDNDDGCDSGYDATYPVYDIEYYGTDLNRNHSFAWGEGGSSPDACSETYLGPSPASEPEVQALETLMRGLFPDQRDPDLDDAAPLSTTGIMITLHSYGQYVLWPWGMTPTRAPNYTGLKAIGDKFASYNGYRSCQSYGCLYQVSGSTDDWAYGELGIPAFTFELGTQFFEPCSALPRIWTANRGALLYAAKIARMPYKEAQGPDARSLSISPAPVGSGAVATLTATISDYASGGQTILLAEAYVDTPPWLGGVPIGLHAADGRFDQPQEIVVGEIDTTDLALGRHPVYVRGRDGGSSPSWGPFTATWLEIVEPDFALSLVPAQVEACASDPVQFSVSVTSPTGGYDAAVSLAVEGLPAGASASFSPPLATPPAVASLDVDLATATPAGAYTMTVSGIGAANRQRSTSAALMVLPPAPASSTLLEPVDGAVLPPDQVHLAWEDTGPDVTYHLQVATDAAFGELVVDGIVDTSETVLTDLYPDETYFWRVRAGNSCGESDWSLPAHFTVAVRRTMLPLILR